MRTARAVPITVARARSSARQKRAILRGREVDAHQRESGGASAWNSAPGASSQPSSSIACASRSVSTPTSTQPNSPRGGAAKRQPWLSASLTVRRAPRRACCSTRSAWRRSSPCSRQWASACSVSAGRGQRGQQLGVDEPVDQRQRRGEEADAPVRRQDLREARDVDRALAARRARPCAAGAPARGARRCRPRRCAGRAPARAAARGAPTASDSEAPVGLCSTDTVTYRRGRCAAAALRSGAASPRGRGRRRRAAPAARACRARPAARTRPTSRARRPAPRRRHAAACA